MIYKTKILKKVLSKIQYGSLELKLPSGELLTFGTSLPKASLHIYNIKAISAMLSEGDIGFGRGYIENWWTSSDIVLLLDVIVANISYFEDAIYGNKFYNLVYKIYDFFHRNTIKHSKKNIEYHYDLGNNFYFKWLDETKSYSSAMFFGNETLQQAQQNKYNNIIKYLPSGVQNILEIGCGWGGFIQQMLSHKADIKIKGLTLSNEQFNYVKDKFDSNPNIKPIIQDYRDEHDKYDAIVSIEMFEAVGREYWKPYLTKVYECLNEGGVAIIQTITIDEAAFEKYIDSSDFIRHFIFPGGVLPTKQIFEELAKECGFEVVEAKGFGSCYRRTLLEWLKNFDSISNQLSQIGFDEKFIRKWRLYLAYCAAGFGEKRTDVYQFVLKKND